MKMEPYRLRSEKREEVVGCNHPVVCLNNGRIILDKYNGYYIPEKSSPTPNYRECVSQYRD